MAECPVVSGIGRAAMQEAAVSDCRHSSADLFLKSEHNSF